MTPEQIAYIEQRRRQIRYWPWMAAALVALLLGAYAWLWRTAPINLNPMLVLEQFHAKVISDEEMILLAARGTLALVACGLFVLVLVLLISLALWNERRLILMIDALRAAAGPVQATGATGPGADDPESAGPGSASSEFPDPGAADQAAPSPAEGAAPAEAVAVVTAEASPAPAVAEPALPSRDG